MFKSRKSFHQARKMLDKETLNRFVKRAAAQWATKVFADLHVQPIRDTKVLLFN